MSGVDHRLLKWSRSARIFVAVSVLLGTLKGLLLVAQAWLLATVVAGTFIDRKDLAQLKVPIGLLLGVFFLRALVAWWQELAANRCSAEGEVDASSCVGPARHHPRARRARESGGQVTWPPWPSGASMHLTPTTHGTFLRSSWLSWCRSRSWWPCSAPTGFPAP